MLKPEEKDKIIKAQSAGCGCGKAKVTTKFALSEQKKILRDRIAKRLQGRRPPKLFL
jgi:hypothetical protein